MGDIAFESATALAAKIKAKEVSSEELLDHYLQRVDQINPDLNAIIVDIRDEARVAARAADAALAKGKDLGPFHGVPTTVKESYNVAGTPTTWGNPDWRENIATEDAIGVTKLKEAGAVVFGKTNVPLMLADFQSYNEVYGTCNNPYDLTRGPGGSSGGSAAALASGMTGLETGSDIGGSIRNPAHFCGVFGHKPTYNLLVMQGHSGPGENKSSTDISVIGPLARSATDLDHAVGHMAGPDEIMSRGYQLNLPRLQGGLKGKKVGVWLEDDMCPVDVEVRQRVENVAQACADAGAHINFDARPAFTAQHSHDTYQLLLQSALSARMPAGDYNSLKAYVETLSDDDPNKATFAAQVASFRDWTAGNELRAQMRWQWHELFKDYDLMLMPIMPTAAFEHDHRPFKERTITINNEERPYFDQVFWAGLTGVSYLPSTVIPTGLNEQGLPIGMQIVGPEYGDFMTIDAAKELETAGFAFTPPPNYA